MKYISIFKEKQFQSEYYPAEASTKLSYSPEINYGKNIISPEKKISKKNKNLKIGKSY